MSQLQSRWIQSGNDASTGRTPCAWVALHLALYESRRESTKVIADTLEYFRYPLHGKRRNSDVQIARLQDRILAKGLRKRRMLDAIMRDLNIGCISHPSPVEAGQFQRVLDERMNGV